MSSFIKTYYKVLILLLIFSTAVFSGLVGRIIDLVEGFNDNVIVFVPTELLFIFPLVAFGMMFSLYHSFKT